MTARSIALAALLAATALPTGPAAGQGAEDVLGIWELVSYTVEVRETGETFAPLGDDPTGYTVFTPEGRVWFTLTGEGREPGETNAERSELFGTMVAYTGLYRIEGDSWITAVDVAWNPAWVGTEQPRNFTLDGDQLEVTTPWRIMPNWADRGETRSINRFIRVSD